ncbi:MAG TPA: hypothetical protein VGY54_17445, partial [Polyangiaceae bacterium]|nr:hypothetical protein [Polyangiaceae bacterium]
MSSFRAAMLAGTVFTGAACGRGGSHPNAAGPQSDGGSAAACAGCVLDPEIASLVGEISASRLSSS